VERVISADGFSSCLRPRTARYAALPGARSFLRRALPPAPSFLRATCSMPTRCSGNYGEKTMRNWHPLAVLALFIVVCFAVAGSGSVFTTGSVRDWYPMLRRPSWTPPSWLFGPVWTILYLMMAIAAWLVWRRRELIDVRSSLGLFAFQLILNAVWSPLFFGLKNPLAGLLDIIPLWAAILATLISFWKIAPAAGILLIPYWFWVSFATALNFAIWKMNR
jgi:translocator protein